MNLVEFLVFLFAEIFLLVHEWMLNLGHRFPLHIFIGLYYQS